MILLYRYPSFVAPCLGLHPVQKSGDTNDAGFGHRSVTIADYDLVEERLITECDADYLAAIGEVIWDLP